MTSTAILASMTKLTYVKSIESYQVTNSLAMRSSASHYDVRYWSRLASNKSLHLSARVRFGTEGRSPQNRRYVAWSGRQVNSMLCSIEIGWKLFSDPRVQFDSRRLNAPEL